MTKAQMLLDKYLSQFTYPEVSLDYTDDGIVTYIDTERFLATSLRSHSVKFEDFDPKIKRLYELTFGDQDVMRLYTDGKIRTIESFTNSVVNHSKIWQHNKLFGALIISDKENGEVVGYERISEHINTDISPDTASIGYCFSKDYHRYGKLGKKNVGYECVGGLVLKYGQEYLCNELLNQFFNTETEKIEGTPLKKIIGAVHPNNMASVRILQKLGFEYDRDCIEFGIMRDYYIKDYHTEELGSMSLHN